LGISPCEVFPAQCDFSAISLLTDCTILATLH